MPCAATLGSYYPDGYWWSPRRRSGAAGLLSRLERAYREMVARDHVRFLRRCATATAGRPTLLDIGCGSGTFLHLARQRGFEVYGMDVSEHAVLEARRQYDLAVKQGEIGSLGWDGGRFDYISMFHVLEHLPDPRQALAYAGGLLKPGGSLIIQVPNAASIQAGIFGSCWYGFDVPRHVINFTPGSLRLLLEQAGFKPLMVRRFSLRDNPAALASSLAVRLDPIGRGGRGKGGRIFLEGAFEGLYFGLVLLCFLPSLIESLCGRGATLWAHATLAAAE
jgi:SAM-dependent methyltransferase